MMVQRWKTLCITCECARHRLTAEAAKMELEPDVVRLIDEHSIAERFVTTTHDLPVSPPITCCAGSMHEVIFSGIQPSAVAFGYPFRLESARETWISTRGDRACDRRCLALA